MNHKQAQNQFDKIRRFSWIIQKCIILYVSIYKIFGPFLSTFRMKILNPFLRQKLEIFLDTFWIESNQIDSNGIKKKVAIEWAD